MAVLTTLACTVDADGIHRPAFADLLETLQATFQAIYGTDAYLDPDSQDGQLLAAFTKAIDDSNATAVAIYNSFSPSTAQGDALSRNVKINGLTRQVATYSTISLRVTGTAGTVILEGAASDENGTTWLLPDEVVIPPAGFIDITATASERGNVTSAAGAVTNIETPTLGWQSVTSLSAAVPGAPIELDAALRRRQAVSVALPSRTVLSGIKGAILAVSGVTQAEVYENDTNVTDSNGVPAKSIAAVVQGGADIDVAESIMRKKGPGCGTYGTTTIPVIDPGGNPMNISFFKATPLRVIAEVTIKALTGYVSTTGDAIKEQMSAYVAAKFGIGKKVDHGKLYLPAQLYGGAGSDTYEVDLIELAEFGGVLTDGDVPVAFNELPALAIADITITVT